MQHFSYSILKGLVHQLTPPKKAKKSMFALISSCIYSCIWFCFQSQFLKKYFNVFILVNGA